MADDKRIALVTGGNRGIGFEICRQLAQRGLKVILTSRDPERGQAATQTLVDEGLDVVYHPLEVTDEDAVRVIYDDVQSTFGKLDVLVNNAAIYPDEGVSVFNLDVAVLRQTLEINTVGPFLMTKAFVPLMRQNGYGRVVNVSSGAGALTGMGGRTTAYKLSKAALNALTRVTASEVDSRRVKVNAMCPGWVRTEMGGAGAPRSVEEGADTAVWLATLPDDGPNNGFFRDRKPIDW